MTETSPEDLFQYWLMDMDDAIDAFLLAVPPEIAQQLDFTPKSLGVLENWLLSIYPDVEATRPSSEAHTLDRAARYIGEVFRKHFGGGWLIELEDKEKLFCGLPQLTGMKAQVGQIAPLTLVTAAMDRRTGHFVQSIFERQVERVAESGA